MAQGEGGGGHFASSGAYGGNYPGGGGITGNVSGAEHGGLGYGGMSPGGFNSTTYSRNLAGDPTASGFGARRAAYQAAARARQRLQGQPEQVTGVNAARRTPPATRRSVNAQTGEVTQVPVTPVVRTPATETDEPIDAPLDPFMGAPPPFGTGEQWSFDPTYNYNPGMLGGRLNPFTGPYGSGPSGGLTRGVTNPQVNRATQSNPGVGTGVKGDNWGSNRQFGGPVAPGQQYTVGENGPETLQMRPGGGGQVIPNNPVDRRQGLVNALQGGMGRGGGITGLRGGMGAPGASLAPQSPVPGGGVGLPRPAPAPVGMPPRMGAWQG